MVNEKRYIVGLDEGTTSARALVYDIKTNKIVRTQSKTFKQFYPQNGWVEQDAEAVYRALCLAYEGVVGQRIDKSKIWGIGLTSQRETVVAFDRQTGKPICRAIVWQCQRTAKEIELLSAKTREQIRQTTGLVPNAYFSASKMAWILKNVPEAKKLLKEQRLCLGTMDSFIAFKLTGRFVTDTTNASRTMLFNIKTLDWDSQMLSLWGIPKECLPEVISSSEIVGKCKDFENLPLCSIIGDQQASLVGHGAISVGLSKITYGTGGFLLVNTGGCPKLDSEKLLATIAYTVNGKTVYALEGSIFSACSAINWAGKNLELFENVEKTEKMANSVSDNGGVYFVPAFTGLGAPYWNAETRACFVGMTFSTTKNHLVRAVLESLGYGANAIVREIEKVKIELKNIKVDGGGSKNRFILQFLADITGKDVCKTQSSECSVLGAIYLSAVALGIIQFEDIKNLAKSVEVFKSSISQKQRTELFEKWENAVEKSCWSVN